VCALHENFNSWFVLLENWLLYGFIVSADKTADKPELYDVFVSYKHTHQELVLKIVDRLKKSGFTVWLDINETCTSYAGL